MELEDKIPLPLEPIKSNKIDDRRLWVGNLDLRVNEYHLLKLVQKYGEIEKFDLMFHRSGPSAGQPRGYAFVTYKVIEDAIAAKEALHNMKIGSKHIVVRWAHNVTESETDKTKPKIEIPALAGAKQDGQKISRKTTIEAIEAKLKLMNESKEEFELNKPLDGTPILQLYQKPEAQKPTTSMRNTPRGSYWNNKPYSRFKSRR